MRLLFKRVGGRIPVLIGRRLFKPRINGSAPCPPGKVGLAATYVGLRMEVSRVRAIDSIKTGA